MGIILKIDLALLLFLVFLDNLTTYYGIFHLKLEEANPIGRYIFENFGKPGIILAFLYEFFVVLVLFVFFRLLRIKVFKTKLQSEYIAFLLPATASINNIYVILLNN